MENENFFSVFFKIMEEIQKTGNDLYRDMNWILVYLICHGVFVICVKYSYTSFAILHNLLACYLPIMNFSWKIAKVTCLQPSLICSQFCPTRIKRMHSWSIISIYATVIWDWNPFLADNFSTWRINVIPDI